MWVGRFDSSGRTPWVDVILHGPLGELPVRFIVDTGSFRTVVDARLIGDLGYDPDRAKRRTRLVGAGSALPGYTMDVSRLETMGLVLESFEVVCQDLPGELGVRGLVGMDLLADRILTIDSIDGRIILAP